MKSLINTSLIILACTAVSCDKVSPTEYLQPQNTIADTLTNETRTVVVENFTGHQCGNCPAGSDVAQAVRQSFPLNSIVYSVHAGFFANPSSSGLYATDYRNPTSTELDQFFKVTPVGNPNGMINRRNFRESNHIVRPDNWISQCRDILAMDVIAALDMQLEFTPSNRAINLITSVNFRQALSNGTSIAFYVIEDSLQSTQKDYRVAANSGDVTNYVHRKVLRGSFNGAFGENLLPSATSGESVSVTKQYSLPAQINPEKTSIVALLIDNGTMEIIQGAEKPLMP